MPADPWVGGDPWSTAAQPSRPASISLSASIPVEEAKPADPWESSDPWSTAAQPSGPASGPREVPNAWGNYSGNAGKGEVPKAWGNYSGDAGKGYPGKGRGRPKASQTTQQRSWFKEMPQPAMGDGQAHASVGRGRIAATPHWMGPTGITTEQRMPSASSEVPPQLQPHGDVYDAMAMDHARARDTLDRFGCSHPCNYSAIEVEVSVDMSICQGPWLNAAHGEVVLASYASGGFVWAQPHCRPDGAAPAGWLHAAHVKLPETHHEFLAKIRAPPGIVCARAIASSGIAGLVVLKVKENGGFATWNQACVSQFPRNQFIPGDFLTFARAPPEVRGESSEASCGITEPAAMAKLFESAEPGVRLHIRVSRLVGIIFTGGSASVDGLDKHFKSREQFAEAPLHAETV